MGVIRPAYTYAAVLDRVIDGDTYVLRVDTGFHVHVYATVRLLGWDTPEMSTPAGPRAKVFAEALMRSAGQITITTEKDAQTFARWLAHVYVDGEELGQKLSDNGLAVRMNR